MNDLISRIEAMKILGVTAPTFRVFVDKGQISPVPFGRRFRYRRAEIVALKEGRIEHVTEGDDR